MNTATIAPDEHYVRLDWDSENFGFPVGKICTPRLDDAALRMTLEHAQSQGVQLMCWPTSADQPAPVEALHAFNGRLVDRKATFAAEMNRVSESTAGGGFDVFVHGDPQPSQALIDLTIASGAYSRFNVDPRFPKAKFHELYRIWIERSVRGPLADVVLVARQCGAPSKLDGFVTVSLKEGVGNIGLIAVSENVRGKGLGSLLMAHAHRWLVRRMAWRTTVVTQLDNGPACRLYEKCGYKVDEVQHYYHFWLN